MLTPGTLDQILEVLRDFKASYAGGDSLRGAYQQACRTVSKREGVAYQTIGDACRRRLGLTNISEFRRLLQEWVNGNPSELMGALKRNTSRAEHYRIDGFFEGHPSKEGASVIEPSRSREEPQWETFSFRLDQKSARSLRALGEMKGQSVPELLAETVSEYVEEHLTELLMHHIKGLTKEQLARLKAMVE